MKIIRQTLFKIEISKAKIRIDVFYVEGSNFEEALTIAKEVLSKYYKEWEIKSITSHAPLFKSSTKTLLVEL